jgi:hypothetical protein
LVYFPFLNYFFNDKIGRVAQLEYSTISAASSIGYGTWYAFITNSAYKPTYTVTLSGQYDTGNGWKDLGLILYGNDGRIAFWGENVPGANVQFRIFGTWFVN